jgi:four helix bundle protein
MAYNDFTEMPVWQLAMEIVGDIYSLTEKLPKKEDYALCGQMRDAAVSIAGNIAEGFGRWHKRDKINFYFYSRGSVCEERSHLISGNKVGYFTSEEILPISNKCKQVVEELNKIIKGLNSNSQPKPQPKPQS